MTYATNSAFGIDPPPTLTVEKLLEIQAQFKTVPILPEIRESEFAVQRQQTRVYARRRAKSDAHHRRMNKKWLKRYGETAKPAAFLMDKGVLGGRGQIMFVHPELMKLVRQSLKLMMDRQFEDVLGGIMMHGVGKSGGGNG